MRRDALRKRLAAIRAKRNQPKESPVIEFPQLGRYKPKHALSDKIDGMCPSKDLMYSHRWKRGAEEKPETVKEIHKKAKRIRPKFGKGAYDYSTDGDNTGPIRIYQKGV